MSGEGRRGEGRGEGGGGGGEGGELHVTPLNWGPSVEASSLCWVRGEGRGERGGEGRGGGGGVSCNIQ